MTPCLCDRGHTAKELQAVATAGLGTTHDTASVRIRPLLLKLLQPCDANVMRDIAAFEACFESQRQAWRASADGLMVDAEIYAQPWGFPLEEIQVPVRLWHGKEDRSFHWQLARSLGERLPQGVEHLVEAEGHYSLPIRHMDEILADLSLA